MNKQLLGIFNPLSLFIRQKGYKHAGGIKYPGGITYYPRDPGNHSDPDYTPSKLFRVERIKPVKHNPYWLKKILAELKIDGEERVTVVKNIPETNLKLWKIKHLVKITPISFPYGEPTEQDIRYTILKENGQCLVTKTLEPAPQQIEALEQFDTDERKMDSTTLKKDSRYKWENAFGGGF